MVDNPAQQITQGGIIKSPSQGVQMRIWERERERKESHSPHGRSRIDVAWSLLTLQGYINSVLVGVDVMLQQSPTFSCSDTVYSLQV